MNMINPVAKQRAMVTLASKDQMVSICHWPEVAGNRKG
jgi:hypothetical protein